MALSKFERDMERLVADGVISRAQFLKIMAAAGVVVAAGTDKAYAAKSNAKGRIVIIGGGAAGISMAAQLKRALKNPDITIIDPSDRQYYQPGFTLIASGVYLFVPKSHQYRIHPVNSAVSGCIYFSDP